MSPAGSAPATVDMRGTQQVAEGVGVLGRGPHVVPVALRSWNIENMNALARKKGKE